jgi:hypothetical protein
MLIPGSSPKELVYAHKFMHLALKNITARGKATGVNSIREMRHAHS